MKETFNKWNKDLVMNNSPNATKSKSSENIRVDNKRSGSAKDI